jgi:hypothetical protein
VQALLNTNPKRTPAMPEAALVWDALFADLAAHAARKSPGEQDLGDWEGLVR